MKNAKDLTNQVFGKLTVLYRSEKGKNGSNKWRCKCECGKEKDIYTYNLTTGKSKSCGCNNFKNLKPDNGYKHGMTGTRIHGIWTHIRYRCYNASAKNYKDYGARGITVCKEWDSFESFYEWSINNGYAANLSIDRIDNNGNYEPSNCRWTTPIVQQNNTRFNRKLTIMGETKNFIEWCRAIGINPKTMYYRLSHNWDEERLISPSRQGGLTNGIK